MSNDVMGEFMAFKQWTTAEKMQYAKQFTKKEINAYRKGKRNGELKNYHKYKHCINKKRTSDFVGRTYSKEEINELFKTLGEIKI